MIIVPGVGFLCGLRQRFSAHPRLYSYKIGYTVKINYVPHDSHTKSFTYSNHSAFTGENFGRKQREIHNETPEAIHPGRDSKKNSRGIPGKSWEEF